LGGLKRGGFRVKFILVMKGRFPFEKLPKYPHLSPQDTVIWEKFIEENPGFFDSVDYDVKVGKPREYKTAEEDVYKKAMEELSRKRIDVVGYKNDKIYIVEIHPSASFETLGQLIGKRSLYQKEFNVKKNLFALLITDREVPDIPELCKENDIIYYLVAAG